MQNQGKWQEEEGEEMEAIKMRPNFSTNRSFYTDLDIQSTATASMLPPMQG